MSLTKLLVNELDESRMVNGIRKLAEAGYRRGNRGDAFGYDVWLASTVSKIAITKEDKEEVPCLSSGDREEGRGCCR